jgi:hypothetical protein
LYQDKKNKEHFFLPIVEEDLEEYKKIRTFNEVWSFTKKLFNNKAKLRLG